MSDKSNITGVYVDHITMRQALRQLRIFLEEGGVHTIFTPNAEIMMDAHTDHSLKSILNGSDMVIADGAGVVLASKILGVSLPEKVSGIDLVRNSFSISMNPKIRYFLFGSKPGVAEQAAKNILLRYPDVEIAGCRNGYFREEDNEAIIDEINSSNADILLVALGAPKQEKWIYSNKSSLKVKVCIGVGGSLDVFAGTVRLAPEFFRKNGLEWLYRLYKEPWRFKRMLKLPRYILLALFTRIKGG
ncbi:N-acetylmannosaminyltransferase [Anaerobacterium chartisolvens]|uniref:N-acetylglucosaminyldiphosphoundecaprenol N-acetyl-beta-D-mannosaminyltransferase n=1 Tax=Anaerobacterium chartisolvens TaxID=1297424 RepID=A0A369AVK8_9FIRM|nr:WecB/TagA/CpsF family glycosyltransferase [Anaerobacterium chartisolvens]RCX12378.1 N-acetylmannosaminyltransferase [Anaerobacterium chartisolvens]